MPCPTRAHLLAAHITGTGVRSSHRGSFSGQRLTLLVDQLLESSTVGLGGSVTVLHDDPGQHRREYRGVALHRLDQATRQRIANIPGNDARWPAIVHSSVLDRAQLAASDCVWAIDLADVRLIADPARLCAAHPTALFTGTDVCSSKQVKKCAASCPHASSLLPVRTS